MAPLAESSSSGPKGNVAAVPSMSVSCCCTSRGRMGAGYPALQCWLGCVLRRARRSAVRLQRSAVARFSSVGDILRFVELINDFVMLAVGQTAQRCSEDVAGNGCKVLTGPQLIPRQ